ncbi:MAG: PorV/PorQ family protein [Candidatus Cloacimonetes bacterium]|nr:PorV/PorQ family protein [Candidatus Cloacimonadota bacterium]
MKIILLTLIMVLLIPFAANAISNAAVIFLLIEPSSRASAMGQAYVAQVDDGFAGYWNPGAMAFNRKTQVASMYSNWFGEIFNDMYYFHIGGNQYVEDIGNLGVNLTYMTYGKQDRTDENGEIEETFSSYDISVAGTYGYQISQKTGMGITFKFILSDLAPEGAGESEAGIKGQGMSYAFDIGLKHKGVDFGQILVSPYNGALSLYNGVASLTGMGKAGLSKYSIPVDKLDFGFNFQNIGPNITYIDDSQSDPLPMNWRMGFSYRILESDLNKFSVNVDMSKVLANDDPVFKRIFSAWTDDFNTQTDDAGNDINDFASINNFINSIEFREIIWNIGAEYDYLNLLSIRTGYIADRAGDIMGMSFGAGIHYTFKKVYLLSIDYAFQPGGGMQDYNQTLSVKVDF